LAYLFPEMLPAAILRRLKAGFSSARTTPTDSCTEFPDLPQLINRALLGVGALSLALRKYVPLGTSLIAVLKRT
jgi:hypothetical protein